MASLFEDAALLMERLAALAGAAPPTASRPDAAGFPAETARRQAPSRASAESTGAARAGASEVREALAPELERVLRRGQAGSLVGSALGGDGRSDG
jgi:hypothetical protein